MPWTAGIVVSAAMLLIYCLCKVSGDCSRYEEDFL